jgi:hypothetical protein
MIHRYIREEPFKKQKDAASKKGVVGSIGRTIPIIPRTRSINPAATNSTFETVILPPYLADMAVNYLPRFTGGHLLPLFGKDGNVEKGSIGPS